MVNKPVKILLVEDNPADVRLIQKAFKDVNHYHNLYVARDGIEAIDFLRKKGKYKDKPRPDLILLDLNLPKKDGREVLREVKTDEELKSVPVIILTISNAENDILDTYNHHANCYINKPVELKQFFEVVKAITDFWLTKVKLPN